MDPYRCLGIDRDAGAKTIKGAFRRLAHQYHPDRNPGDPEAAKRFRELRIAYELLIDPKRRRWHDLYGGRVTRPTREPARPSKPVVGEAEISFLDALRGTRCTARFEGIAGGAHKLPLTVPPGTFDGEQVDCRSPQLLAKGWDNLKVKVRVREHENYELHERDIYGEVLISAAEAYAGAKIYIPTPWGEVKLRLRPGTNSGAKIRVRGHGLRKGSGPPGDFLARLRIAMPERGNDDLRLAMLWASLDEGEIEYDPTMVSRGASDIRSERRRIQRRLDGRDAQRRKEVKVKPISADDSRVRSARRGNDETVAFGKVSVRAAASMRRHTMPLALNFRSARVSRVDLRVPEGVRNGQILRLREALTFRGRKIDALLEVRIKPDRGIERDGDDVFIDLPVSLFDLYAGSLIEVPTLDGLRALQLPTGLEDGDYLHVANEGVRVRGMPRGDLIYRLQLYLPEAGDDNLVQMLNKVTPDLGNRQPTPQRDFDVELARLEHQEQVSA